jgi:hypothetical protein
MSAPAAYVPASDDVEMTDEFEERKASDRPAASTPAAASLPPPAPVYSLDADEQMVDVITPASSSMEDGPSVKEMTEAEKKAKARQDMMDATRFRIRTLDGDIFEEPFGVWRASELIKVSLEEHFDHSERKERLATASSSSSAAPAATTAPPAAAASSSSSSAPAAAAAAASTEEETAAWKREAEVWAQKKTRDAQDAADHVSMRVNVSTASMKLIIQLWRMWYEKPFPEQEKEVDTDAMIDLVPENYAQWADAITDIDVVKQLLEDGIYLDDSKCLQEVATAMIATRITGKTSEEMCAILKEECDFTEEEKKQMAEENKWLAQDD